MYKSFANNLNVRFDFWHKYKKCDPNIFITVFNILINKTKTSEFNFDFHYWNLFERNELEFEKDYELLKSIYIFKDNTDSHFDYDKKYLNKIVKIDNEFLFEFLNLKYPSGDYISSKHTNYRFDFIWEHDNYEYLIEKSIETLMDKSSIADNIINVFFPLNTSERVTDFISKFVIKYHTNIEKLKKIFNVITYTYPKQRLYFLSILLEHINDLKPIESLELIQGFKSGGSLIPLYEEDRKFWKDLEDLFSNDVKYLKLKLWTKEMQASCERSIEWHRKMDFVSDF
jgi:hypothetical protein